MVVFCWFSGLFLCLSSLLFLAVFLEGTLGWVTGRFGVTGMFWGLFGMIHRGWQDRPPSKERFFFFSGLGGNYSKVSNGEAL